MLTVGIKVLATNGYFILGCRFINRFHHLYSGNAKIVYYFFGDRSPYEHTPTGANIKYHHIENDNWVNAVNTKFANVLKINDKLDYIYYFDADTNIVRPFDIEWFVGDLVAGEHGYHINTPKEQIPFDRNPLSSCYIPHNTPLEQKYYYGAFWGGRVDRVREFCSNMIMNQQLNKAIGHEPIWNDDSYANHYFHYNTPSRVVSHNDFQFVVSCKGGLKIDRDPTVSFPEHEIYFQLNKERLLNIKDNVAQSENY